MWVLPWRLRLTAGVKAIQLALDDAYRYATVPLGMRYCGIHREFAFCSTWIMETPWPEPIRTKLI